MKNCIGIINSGSNRSEYGSLSKTRPDYMLPFGGRYRIIDFSLSNMSNYNLSQVMLYAVRNIRSTLDHIGDGKNWELNRRNNGLVINPPSYDDRIGEHSEIRTFYDSLIYYENSSAEHVYLENPMTIAKVNLRQAYQHFIDCDYDVMIVYSNVEDLEGRYLNMNKLLLDSNDSFVNMGINLGTERRFNLSLGRAFFKKKVFIDIVRDSIEKGNARSIVQAVINNRSRLKIGVYRVETYIEAIRDIVSYYRANLALLDREKYNELFYKGGMVYTKSKDEPSSLYKAGSRVSNSLIANGCIIEGQIENSIIFRGVHVHKNAIVRNCILIQKTDVEEDSVLVNVVSDKYSQVKAGVSLVGSPMNPFVIAKNEVISR